MPKGNKGGYQTTNRKRSGSPKTPLNPNKIARLKRDTVAGTKIKANFGLNR